MEDSNRNNHFIQQAPQMDNDNNLHSITTEARSGQSQAAFNPNFIANRAKRVVANR